MMSFCLHHIAIIVHKGYFRFDIKVKTALRGRIDNVKNLLRDITNASN